MEAYALTDVGQKRSMNQDSVYARTKSIGSLENLFIVADGMGGHQAGDFASNFVVENLVRFFETPYPERDVHGILKEGIRKVNRDLYECTSRDPKLNGAGSTLCWLPSRVACFMWQISETAVFIFCGKHSNRSQKTIPMWKNWLPWEN